MTNRFLIAAATLLAVSLTTISARQTITTIAVDADDIADAVREDSRDRRPGTLLTARFAEGELHPVRARLWISRFAARRRRIGKAVESERGVSAQRSRRRANLPGRILAVAAADSRGR